MFDTSTLLAAGNPAACTNIGSHLWMRFVKQQTFTSEIVCTYVCGAFSALPGLRGAAAQVVHDSQLNASCNIHDAEARQ